MGLTRLVISGDYMHMLVFNEPIRSIPIDGRCRLNHFGQVRKIHESFV